MLDLCSNIPVNIPTLYVLVPVYSAYKNLVIGSIGLSRFSRFGSSFSSRTGMSSLGCVINFSRYLVLCLVISALTVGVCRSVCIAQSIVNSKLTTAQHSTVTGFFK